MSNIIHDALVTIILADYAAPDATGKFNALGGGISLIGEVLPGQSAPFAVVVEVAVPEKYVGKQYALTIELHDITLGNLVQVPNEVGGVQPLRAQQLVTVSPFALPPGTAKPQDLMLEHRMVMNFVNGLPLERGHSFEVRVQIDGDKRKGWHRRFYSIAPGPGVVFGGQPDGPADIPGVGDFTVPDDEAPEGVDK